MPFSSIVYHICVRCVGSHLPFNLVGLFPVEFHCIYKLEIMFRGSMSIHFGSMYDEANASYISIRFPHLLFRAKFISLELKLQTLILILIRVTLCLLPLSD